MSWFNSLFSLNFGWCLVSVSRVPFFFINTDTKCRKQMFSRLSERQCLSSVVGAPNFISEKNCQHLLNFHCRYCSSEESPQKCFITTKEGIFIQHLMTNPEVAIKYNINILQTQVLYSFNVLFYFIALF